MPVKKISSAYTTGDHHGSLAAEVQFSGRVVFCGVFPVWPGSITPRAAKKLKKKKEQLFWRVSLFERFHASIGTSFLLLSRCVIRIFTRIWLKLYIDCLLLQSFLDWFRRNFILEASNCLKNLIFFWGKK